MRTVSRRELLRTAGILGTVSAILPLIKPGSATQTNPYVVPLYARVFSEKELSDTALHLAKRQPHIVNVAESSSTSGLKDWISWGWGGAVFWDSEGRQAYGTILLLPLPLKPSPFLRSQRGLGILIMGELAIGQKSLFITVSIEKPERCVVRTREVVVVRKRGKCKVKIDSKLECEAESEIEIECQEGEDNAGLTWKAFGKFFAEARAHYEYEREIRDRLANGLDWYLCDPKGDPLTAWQKLWVPPAIRSRGLILLTSLL